MGEGAAGEAAIPQAERHLMEGIARILRATAGAGWMVLVLHLSRVAPSGPRAHHRRVVASMLEDVAGRSDGQLFALSNGDIVLLFRPADAGVGAGEVIKRLFGSAVPDVAAIQDLWSLPEEGRQALEYVRGRALERDRAPAELQATAGVIAAMNEVVATAPLAELMQRQTSIVLRPQAARPVMPYFREVSISTAVLEARLASAGHAQADPFLFNHLAAQLDRRMLVALADDIPAAGPLSGGLGGAALHVNLTLSGILSEGFASLAGACQDAVRNGLRLAVEVPFVELFADPKAFILARERVRLARLGLVLDGMTHDALLLMTTRSLDPDLVKLSWSRVLPELGPELDVAIARVGAERIVLHRCDDKAALAWGLRRGIERFQGYGVDQLLAAARLAGCDTAAACTLRQCGDRAKATGTAGRAGCLSPTLLDMAAPERLLKRASAPEPAAA